MATPVNPPRGMRDFLPVDKAKRERALATIRAVYARHGFDEIETPALEEAGRLHSGLGGDNEKLAFGVLRRGLGDDDLRAAVDAGSAAGLSDLGLRFDLTVPLARFAASHRAELPTVFRAVQIGAVWRAERPQKGRYRQFVQCDIDILGEPGALAEIELIAATADALDALGVTGTSVRINDRRILQRLLATWGVQLDAVDRALITIDKLDKIGVAGVAAELAASGVGHPDIAATLEALPSAGWDLLAAGAPAWLDADAYAELLAIREAVPGVDLVFDPSLVRGMGYYTGTIFEIAHPASGSSVGGGGRYDGMIGRFSGQQVPAVGFSIGFERILDLLPDHDGGDDGAVALLFAGDVPPARLLAEKRRLVGEGVRVRLERARKNRGPQLDALRAAGFDRVGTIGADDAPVELRPLAARS